MDAVSLSNRALLTEVIPMARSGGEEGEEDSEGRIALDEPHTLTHKKKKKTSHNVPLSPGL